ncbi:hypothetical protein [Alicyclobacillus acidocaldarius]|uniref:Uncharacterized protein n=1 Tax=Alicyclobacillus acidocaldarius subsp. acidocaldarius (strain ATCC 27009 / DSM 446 / BCRC 14685 / JCM 5260 / KCTC 1825 / NBRC 15652 / NCIMB 11725 / NRRL B-14509 / 104-IA) TaxID=521098 RepID=C8WWT5_ALIAD|nr:hypothetical protein [Alicyclobacillus acidocaldarius]ACV58557.1 hypothetical protein Aaci_1542 [Alicyclobacillus acidocaldarius subsp. acidocaldarius DSM 446]
MNVSKISLCGFLAIFAAIPMAEPTVASAATHSKVSTISTQALTASSVQTLPDGGQEYIYYINGVKNVFPVPPKGFNPLTATDAQLREYGFPPRPSDPQNLQQWEQEMSHWKRTLPPKVVMTNISHRLIPYNISHRLVPYKGITENTSDAEPIVASAAAHSKVSTISTQALTASSVQTLPDGGQEYIYYINGVKNVFPVPPKGFNPLTATDAQLREYGFPPRPSDPQNLQQWEQEMSHWKRTLPPKVVMTNISHRLIPYTGTAENISESVFQTSNWSGYYNFSSYNAGELPTEPLDKCADLQHIRILESDRCIGL